MNKKVLIFFGIATLLILISALLSKLIAPKTSIKPPMTSTPQSTPISSKNVYPKYAQGKCETSSDCTPSGCSAQICSSDPGIITTCEIIPDHPKNSGFICRCVENKCAWFK